MDNIEKNSKKRIPVILCPTTTVYWASIKRPSPAEQAMARRQPLTRCSSRLHTTIENALHKESNYFSKPAKSGRPRSMLHLAGLCRKRQQPKPMDGINMSTKKGDTEHKSWHRGCLQQITCFESKARETPNPTVLIRFQR